MLGFCEAAVKTLTAKISATKKLPATDATEEPYYANLISSIHLELSEVHYDQLVVGRVSVAPAKGRAWLGVGRWKGGRDTSGSARESPAGTRPICDFKTRWWRAQAAFCVRVSPRISLLILWISRMKSASSRPLGPPP